MRTHVCMMVAVGVLCGVGVTAMAGEVNGGVKGGDRAGKITEIKEKRDAKHDEHMAKWADKHTEFGAKLNERLAKNKKLSDADKAEILAFYDEQYGENTAFRDEQHDENMAFLDSLADSGLTKEQIKEKVKAHVATQKAENKEHRSSQVQERKALRERLGPGQKDGDGTKTRTRTRTGGKDKD